MSTARIRRPVGRALILLGRAAVLFLCLPCAPLLADGVADFLPEDFTGWRHTGPLGWKATLALNDAGYHSNIFSTATEEVDDYTGALSPQVDLVYRPGPRSLVTATERLSSVLYAQTRSLNAFGAQSSLGGQLSLNHFRFQGSGSYSTQRTRPIERLDLRPRQTDIGGQAGVSYAHGNRFTAGLSGSIYDTTYRDDLREPFVSYRTLLNRRETRGVLDSSYRIARKTWFTAAAESMWADFNESGNPRNSRWDRFLGGVRFRPSSSGSGFIRAGLLRISPDRAGDPSFSGPVLSSNLSYRVGDALLLGLTANRDLQFAVYLNNSWLVRATYSAHTDWFMTPRLALTVGGEFSMGRFPEEAVAPRRDRDRRTYLGLLRKIGSSMEAGVRYTMFRRNSTLNEFDLETSSFTGSFAYVF